MAGFRNVKQWVDANITDGKNWFSTFRKVPPSGAITIAGQWFDYSTAGGVPLPNYYASEPQKSAVVDVTKGIYVPSVLPDYQFLSCITTMSGASGVTVTTSQKQTLFLLDYLLYYPFFDLDAVAEVQDTTGSTVALPRYTTGARVQMMLVTQSATTGGGSYQITYTNSAGVGGRVTPTIYCPAASPSGALMTGIGAAAAVSPFCPLQAGDSGVRSVESITMLDANGGLAAIVLVMPLQMTFVNEECRLPTSSPTENYGDAFQIRRITMQSGSPRIYDGAVLGFIGLTFAGSIASSQLVGYIETIWG